MMWAQGQMADDVGIPLSPKPGDVGLNTALPLPPVAELLVSSSLYSEDTMDSEEMQKTI